MQSRTIPDRVPDPKKQKREGWVDYAEDLKILVNKAFPDLQEEARDLLAMNHFLNQLDNPVGTAELYRLQLDDPVVGILLTAKEIGKRPLEKSVKDNPKSRRLLQIWDQLVIKENLLFRKFDSQDGTSSHLQCGWFLRIYKRKYWMNYIQ